MTHGNPKYPEPAAANWRPRVQSTRRLYMFQSETSLRQVKEASSLPSKSQSFMRASFASSSTSTQMVQPSIYAQRSRDISLVQTGSYESRYGAAGNVTHPGVASVHVRRWDVAEHRHFRQTPFASSCRPGPWQPSPSAVRARDIATCRLNKPMSRLLCRA